MKKQCKNVGAIFNRPQQPNNNGITLIALVITIIVLLILAGVSLSLVAGGNGIIEKTGKAVDASIESTAIEEVELIIAEANMQYYLDENVRNETLAEYLVQNFSPRQTGSGADVTFCDNGSIRYEGANGAVILLEMSENGKVDIKERADGTKIEKTVTYNANGGTGVPATQTYERKATVNVDFSTLPTRENYTFLGWATTSDATRAQYTENGTKSFTMGTSNITLYAVWSNKAVDMIKASNYGDAVDYTANGISDWKVFLNDGSNIYLIASDHVPNSELNKATNIVNGDGDYTVKATDNRKTLFDWLTTESYWTKYAEGFSGATATGGPTLEQYVASWNEKGYEKLYTATTETVMDDGLTGYYVGNTENPTTTYINMSSTSGYNDTLYYPHQSVENDCHAYWLTSSSAHSLTVSLMSVYYYYGNVDFSSYYDTRLGVRPLVCLPANVKMNWNGSKWNLEN